MGRSVAIIGFGGHARVLLAALRAADMNVVAATCLEVPDSLRHGIEVMTDDELTRAFAADSVSLALGLGTVRADCADGNRERIVDGFVDAGYDFVGVQHPFCCVCPDSEVALSSQVFAGAVVQAGAKVGDFSILNTNCSVDHDCVVGKFCHIAPGVTLSGNVEVGDYAHVGTGANVIQGVRIGVGATVAAGATVIKDVPPGAIVGGTPAREIGKE